MVILAVLCFTGCDKDGKKTKKGTDEPASPVVIGKLVVTPPAMQVAKGSAFEAGEGFFVQQMDVIEGAEIRRLAEGLVLKNHPEIQPAPVNIQLTRVRGSNIINIIGRGKSPAYSAALVDAVMESYVSMVSPADTNQASPPMADPVLAEKNLKETERTWNAFRLENDATRMNAELSAAERKQKRLEVAVSFYEKELNMAAKLGLEQDIRRRQASPGLPSEMPAELAALANTALTVAEIAYLSGLRGTSASALEAARKAAEKDREERARLMTKQLEIARDFSAATESDIARIRALLAESDKLQTMHREAQATYAEKKSIEKKWGGELNAAAHPGVSIIEHAARARGN